MSKFRKEAKIIRDGVELAVYDETNKCIIIEIICFDRQDFCEEVKNRTKKMDNLIKNYELAPKLLHSLEGYDVIE